MIEILQHQSKVIVPISPSIAQVWPRMRILATGSRRPMTGSRIPAKGFLTTSSRSFRWSWGMPRSMMWLLLRDGKMSSWSLFLAQRLLRPVLLSSLQAGVRLQHLCRRCLTPLRAIRQLRQLPQLLWQQAKLLRQLQPAQLLRQLLRQLQPAQLLRQLWEMPLHQLSLAQMEMPRELSLAQLWTWLSSLAQLLRQQLWLCQLQMEMAHPFVWFASRRWPMARWRHLGAATHIIFLVWRAGTQQHPTSKSVALSVARSRPRLVIELFEERMTSRLWTSCESEWVTGRWSDGWTWPNLVGRWLGQASEETLSCSRVVYELSIV